MSEAEKKRRADYKNNRKRWMSVLTVAFLVVLVAALALSYLYYNTGKSFYISYTEQGDVDYRVYLNENAYFEEEYIGSDQVYVASLIDRVWADFCYELVMEEPVNYRYSYRVDAVLEVAHSRTDKVIYAPVYPLVEEKTVDAPGAERTLKIREAVEVDYATYNKMAEEFVTPLGLKDVESRLVLEMTIDVISTCDSFEAENTRNSYVVSLHVPLSTQLVDVEMTSTVPQAESKILACTNNSARAGLGVATMVVSGISALLLASLVIYALATRNTDINYEIKVSRLVAKYKSYIQQVTNVFDETGYQVLLIKTFAELLEIRDTIDSPILMNENEDKTCTRFIIPTNSKMLYVYEIKVEDYDQIYAVAEQPATQAAEEAQA